MHAPRHLVHPQPKLHPPQTHHLVPIPNDAHPLLLHPLQPNSVQLYCQSRGYGEVQGVLRAPPQLRDRGPVDVRHIPANPGAVQPPTQPPLAETLRATRRTTLLLIATPAAATLLLPTAAVTATLLPPTCKLLANYVSW